MKQFFLFVTNFFFKEDDDAYISSLSTEFVVSTDAGVVWFTIVYKCR